MYCQLKPCKTYSWLFFRSLLKKLPRRKIFIFLIFFSLKTQHGTLCTCVARNIIYSIFPQISGMKIKIKEKKFTRAPLWTLRVAIRSWRAVVKKTFSIFRHRSYFSRCLVIKSHQEFSSSPVRSACYASACERIIAQAPLPRATGWWSVTVASGSRRVCVSRSYVVWYTSGRLIGAERGASAGEQRVREITSSRWRVTNNGRENLYIGYQRQQGSEWATTFRAV